MIRTLRHLVLAPLALLPVACFGVPTETSEDIAGEERVGEVEQALFLCGDGVCASAEDCETCPEDCGGSCASCGNGICGGGDETCHTCPYDCGACSDADGDGVIDENDNCVNSYNPTQSDCDGDGQGNACDPENGTFVPAGEWAPCHVDRVAATFAYVKIKIVSERLLMDTSACHAPTKYEERSVPWWCLGKTGYDCCLDAFLDLPNEGEICGTYWRNDLCHN